MIKKINVCSTLASHIILYVSLKQLSGVWGPMISALIVKELRHKLSNFLRPEIKQEQTLYKNSIICLHSICEAKATQYCVMIRTTTEN